MFNAELQHYQIKSLMETVKNKFKNIRNEHLKSIDKDTNFVLSLKQAKKLV